MVVNLGIGIPTLVPGFVSPGVRAVFHAENGILGYGPAPAPGAEDAFLVNAGGLPITAARGAAYFDSTVAFGIIRRGLLDLTILGALQVSARGDLANWLVPGQLVPGIGGAMELAQKAARVIVVTTHTNKRGEPKVLYECTYPLTARAVVDLIITDLAVIEVTSAGLVLREVAEPHTVDAVVSATAAPLLIPASVRRF